METSQYDITIGTHYGITMGNNIASDAHCGSQWLIILLGTSIVMSQ